MELDKLKQAWKQTNNDKQTLKKDIMEFIQQPQYGPIAVLKKEFRKQIALVILIMVFISITTIRNVFELRNNILFWSYMAFCAAVIIFHFINYRIARRMEVIDGDVKSNLQKQINSLETRLKWKRIALPLVALFFIALVEILPYYQRARMLDKWHALPVFTRIGAYVAFLILQFFANRRVTKIKFGNHLEYLKKLVKDME